MSETDDTTQEEFAQGIYFVSLHTVASSLTATNLLMTVLNPLPIVHIHYGHYIHPLCSTSQALDVTRVNRKSMHKPFVGMGRRKTRHNLIKPSAVFMLDVLFSCF